MHGSDRLQALLDRLDLIEYANIFRKEKIDDGILERLNKETRGEAFGFIDLGYRDLKRLSFAAMARMSFACIWVVLLFFVAG